MPKTTRSTDPVDAAIGRVTKPIQPARIKRGDKQPEPVRRQAGKDKKAKP